MSNIKEKIFWEKYRPNTLKGMILLPRIDNIIKSGIHSNMIFYGTSGTGKTTLANILSEEHNYLKLNGKLGVDILTTTIKKHFQSLNLSAKSDLKVIYIDEFDRASSQLQESLKGFMEEYNQARFIFTTNHLNRIDNELRSRFVEIGFDPIDQEERTFLFNKQVNYLRAIAKKEEFELYKNKESFEKLTKKYFPDLRKSIEMLNITIISGDLTMFDKDYGKGKEELYNFIMIGDINPLVNYDYVMDNYFVDFEDAFKYLGRPFFDFLRENYPEIIITKGALILKTQGEYNKDMDNVSDPLIHLINYILSLKEIIKK